MVRGGCLMIEPIFTKKPLAPRSRSRIEFDPVLYHTFMFTVSTPIYSWIRATIRLSITKVTALPNCRRH